MVELKPWRNGTLNELLLVLPVEGPWDEILVQARGRLDELKNAGFGRTAQLTIHIGVRAVSQVQLESLVDEVRTTYGLLTVAVVATEMATQEAAHRLTLNVYMMLPGSTTSENEIEAASGSNALYIGSTVRSGQRIVHHGNIIVNGDVNAGAEVVATGDVLIFGTLRGLAHAGSHGDEKAKIVAGVMRPQQLRIAGQIARAPAEAGPSAHSGRSPEVARIENGGIQVFPA